MPDLNKLREEIAGLPTTRWADEWDRPVPIQLPEWRAAVLTVIDRYRRADREATR